MNYHQAYQTLQFEANDEVLTLEQLKKQYRLQALKYHPDKNKSPGSVAHFQEIQTAYDFLKKYIVLYGGEFDDEYNLEEEELENEEEDPWNYNTLLMTFLSNLLHNEHCQAILLHITSLCEEKALDYLKNKDELVLGKIRDFVILYKDVLHFSDSFVENIQSLIQTKIRKKTVHEKRINVSTEDLWNNNIYKLTHEGQVFLIPVWHHELVYDVSGGGELRVLCSPYLGHHIKIDAENNILVDLFSDVRELLENQKLEFSIGSKNYTIDGSMIHVLHHQTITFEQTGITRPNADDIYNIEAKSNVVVSLTLF